MSNFLEIAKRLVYAPIIVTLVTWALMVAGWNIPITTIVGFWVGSVLCWIVFARREQ